MIGECIRMKFREIKHRIIAVLMLTTLTFTSIPVYAETPDEIVAEEVIENEDNSENSESGENEAGSDDENGGDESANETQVLEVTVTLLSEGNSEDASEETEQVENNIESSEETEQAENNTESTEETVLAENNTESTEETVLAENNTESTEETEQAENNTESTEETEQAENNTESTEETEQAENKTEGTEETEQAENKTEGTEETEQAENNTEGSEEIVLIENNNEALEQKSQEVENLANGNLDGQLMTDEYKQAYEDPIVYTKSIDSVSTSQSSTGRYNVSFTITEKNESTGEEKKFLYTISGLYSEKDIEELLNNMTEGKYGSSDTIYKFSNPNLIDAEKKHWEYSEEVKVNPDADPLDDYDSNHCWAGGASDMLVLSGWYNADSIVRPDGNNLSDEDDVFDYFNHKWEDAAGAPHIGIQWFFSGINAGQNNIGRSHLKNEDYSSPLLKDYCAQDFTYFHSIKTENGLIDELKKLDYDSDGDRCALGLVIGYYQVGEDGKAIITNSRPGHCITIAGYSTDENGTPTSIVLIDSDSYNSDGSIIVSSKDNDERAYKNTYTTYPLRYYDGYWHLMNYYRGDKYDTILDQIDVLKYYSDNTKNKVEQGGTKDLVNYADIVMQYLSTYKDEDDSVDCDTFYEGEGVNMYAYLCNFSTVFSVLGTDTISYRLEITKDGQIIRSRDYSVDVDGSNFKTAEIYKRFVDENSSLAPGEYLLNFIVNPSRDITEAYYNNNSKGYRFIILKRVDENGNEHYEVVSVEDNEINDDNEENDQDSILNTLTDLNDYSFVEDQSDYINNPLKNFHFMFKGGFEDVVLTDADLANAEVLFSYSASGELSGSGINFSTNISITKDDYSIVRNADGTVSVVFSNEFMKKLPKGVHYFKMLIGGKIRSFKVEIK